MALALSGDGSLSAQEGEEDSAAAPQRVENAEPARAEPLSVEEINEWLGTSGGLDAKDRRIAAIDPFAANAPPFLVEWSCSAGGGARERVRRLANTVDLTVGAGEVLWSEVAIPAAAARITLEASVAGKAVAMLRLRSVGDETEHFVRADANGLRLTSLARGRERLKAERLFTTPAKKEETSDASEKNDGRDDKDAPQDGAPTAASGRRVRLELTFGWLDDAGTITLHSGDERLVVAEGLPAGPLYLAAGARDGGVEAARATFALCPSDAWFNDGAARVRSALALLRMRAGVRTWLTRVQGKGAESVRDALALGAGGEYAKCVELLAKSDDALAAELRASAGFFGGIEPRADRVLLTPGVVTAEYTGNADHETARDIIDEFRRVAAETASFYQKMLPRSDVEGERPWLEIVLIRRADDFARLLLLHAHERADALGALFVEPTGVWPARVYVCGELGREAVRRGLRHEMWHAWLGAIDPAAAQKPWLNEGAAVVMSAVIPARAEGEPHDFVVPEEADGLVNDLVKLLSSPDAAGRLRAFVGLAREEFYEAGKSEEHYALAWAMVWYVAQRHNGSFLAHGREFIEALTETWESRDKKYLAERAAELASALTDCLSRRSAD